MAAPAIALSRMNWRRVSLSAIFVNLLKTISDFRFATFCPRHGKARFEIGNRKSQISIRKPSVHTVMVLKIPPQFKTKKRDSNSECGAIKDRTFSLKIHSLLHHVAKAANIRR